MADDTGPPKGDLKFMTPFMVVDDPPPSEPISKVKHPEKTPTERAMVRFSLAGKKAIGQETASHQHTLRLKHLK